MFARLGNANEMKDMSGKIPATPVGESVTRGDVDIGCQQISELKVASRKAVTCRKTALR